MFHTLFCCRTRMLIKAKSTLALDGVVVVVVVVMEWGYQNAKCSSAEAVKAKSLTGTNLWSPVHACYILPIKSTLNCKRSAGLRFINVLEKITKNRRPGIIVTALQTRVRFRLWSAPTVCSDYSKGTQKARLLCAGAALHVHENIRCFEYESHTRAMWMNSDTRRVRCTIMHEIEETVQCGRSQDSIRYNKPHLFFYEMWRRHGVESILWMNTTTTSCVEVVPHVL